MDQRCKFETSTVKLLEEKKFQKIFVAFSQAEVLNMTLNVSTRKKLDFVKIKSLHCLKDTIEEYKDPYSGRTSLYLVMDVSTL